MYGPVGYFDSVGGWRGEGGKEGKGVDSPTLAGWLRIEELESQLACSKGRCWVGERRCCVALGVLPPRNPTR